MISVFSLGLTRRMILTVRMNTGGQHQHLACCQESGRDLSRGLKRHREVAYPEMTFFHTYAIILNHSGGCLQSCCVPQPTHGEEEVHLVL